MQAVLPPPFPSASPQRCYVSNMAVARGFRRRGAATALLHACSRLGAPCRACWRRLPVPHAHVAAEWGRDAAPAAWGRRQ